MQKTTLLHSILVLGILIEGINLQTLFFEFAQLQRPHWYALFQHATAVIPTLFLLACIVFLGKARKTGLSWVMAGLTSVISLYAYREVATFSVEHFSLDHTQLVVLILSVVVPLLMAHLTHEIEAAQTVQVTLEDRIKAKALQEVEQTLFAPPPAYSNLFGKEDREGK